MDPVTQGLLGAAVGQAFAPKLGRRAVAFGAAVAMTPDLDVVIGMVGGPLAEWRHHRGVTHALWFGPVVGPPVGYAMWRFLRWRARRRGAPPEGEPAAGRGALAAWCWLAALALFTHPLLDAFTVYGTQLLAPFSDVRFALPAVGVIDPIYSLILLAGLVAGLFVAARSRVQVALAGAALALSTAFLGYGLLLNGRAEAEAARQLAAEGVAPDGLRAYPTILQPWYRRLVARDGDRVLVGYLSTWDPHPIPWLTFEDGARGSAAAEAVLASPEGRLFAWFADRQTLVRAEPDGPAATLVRVHDLRIGLPDRADKGLWGIRARVAGDGRLLEAPAPFATEYEAGVADVLELLRRTFDARAYHAAAGGGRAPLVSGASRAKLEWEGRARGP
ncbi:MAG TPA: metal-dependent hydrolase [Geminicoccaceae bacterium]|nr:metal-dependent hydrolase [Geminicoccaceae bacterium]